MTTAQVRADEQKAKIIDAAREALLGSDKLFKASDEWKEYAAQILEDELGRYLDGFTGDASQLQEVVAQSISNVLDKVNTGDFAVTAKQSGLQKIFESYLGDINPDDIKTKVEAAAKQGVDSTQLRKAIENILLLHGEENGRS